MTKSSRQGWGQKSTCVCVMNLGETAARGQDHDATAEKTDLNSTDEMKDSSLASNL